MQLVQAPQPGFATDITRHLSCWRPVGLSVLHLSDISIRYVMNSCQRLLEAGYRVICYKFFGNLAHPMPDRHSPLNGGQSTNRASIAGLSGNCRPNGDLTPIQLPPSSNMIAQCVNRCLSWLTECFYLNSCSRLLDGGYRLICYKFFGNLIHQMPHRHSPLNGGQSTNRAGVTGLSGNCRPNGDLTPIQLDSNSAHVIPAKTGIQKHRRPWMPVFTGMTRRLFHTNPTITEPSHAAH